MRRIGVRELRQQASMWLRRVDAGESFEITDRGRPVALLVPVRGLHGIQRLIALGQVSPSAGDILELGDPLLPDAGRPLPSAVLANIRAGEC